NADRATSVPYFRSSATKRIGERPGRDAPPWRFEAGQTRDSPVIDYPGPRRFFVAAPLVYGSNRGLIRSAWRPMTLRKAAAPNRFGRSTCVSKFWGALRVYEPPAASVRPKVGRHSRCGFANHHAQLIRDLVRTSTGKDVSSRSG